MRRRELELASEQRARGADRAPKDELMGDMEKLAALRCSLLHEEVDSSPI